MFDRCLKMLKDIFSVDHLLLGDEHHDNEHDMHANTNHEIISQALDGDGAKDDNIMR